MIESSPLRDFAEVPERYTDIPDGISLQRWADDRRCVLRDDIWATVGAIRVGTHDIDELIDEVRALVGPDLETNWQIGPSSQPSTLLEELTARGFAPVADRPSELRALLLTTEPEGPDDVDVRLVESYEDYIAARESSWDAFGHNEQRRSRERPVLRQWFDDMVRTGTPAQFLAYDKGRLAGTAVAFPATGVGVLLGGGSVASWARGRGIYRALVRARWRYAVQCGTPALVTHANPATSYPVLMRLGFEEVGTITRVADGGTPSA